MAAIDQTVNVQIILQSAGISLPGFGIPAIFADPASNLSTSLIPAGSPVLAISGVDELTALGASTTDRAVLMATAIFSQRPSPTQVKIIRRSTPVAQVSTVTVSDATDGTYTITLNGIDIDVAAAGNTITEIRDNLISAAAAHPDVAGRVTVAAGGAGELTLTATVAGISFTAAVASPANGLAIAATTASVGLSQDLDAAIASDPNFYGLLLGSTSRSDDEIFELARAVEADNFRILFAQSNDATILSTPFAAGTPAQDIANRLSALNMLRTSVWYHSDDSGTQLDAAIAGRQLATTPGSSTAKFKRLQGVTADVLTTSQRNNLISKNANAYETFAGTAITFEGFVASGEYIDTIRGIDWLQQRIQVRMLEALLRNEKVPFTQAGIAILAAGMRGAFNEGVASGLIAGSRTNVDGEVESPAFTITPPQVSDIPVGDRENRTIPASNPIRGEFTLAGAIHIVNVRVTASV